MCDSPFVLTPQAVWIACNFSLRTSTWLLTRFQYRKRYGLHAIVMLAKKLAKVIEFQYRKRYGLHAIMAAHADVSDDLGFNTASGMDCMQFAGFKQEGIKKLFQYRKRYGLHAIGSRRTQRRKLLRFNTASGMDCMQ